GKVPFDTAAAAKPEEDGPKTVAVLDKDCVVDEWRALIGRPDQIARGYVGERQIGGQRGLRQVRRPKSLARCFPEGLALKELDSRYTAFRAAPGLHHGLQHFEAMKIVGFNGTGVDRDRFGDFCAARDFQWRTPLSKR